MTLDMSGLAPRRGVPVGRDGRRRADDPVGSSSSKLAQRTQTRSCSSTRVRNSPKATVALRPLSSMTSPRWRPSRSRTVLPTAIRSRCLLGRPAFALAVLGGLFAGSSLRLLGLLRGLHGQVLPNVFHQPCIGLSGFEAVDELLQLLAAHEGCILLLSDLLHRLLALIQLGGLALVIAAGFLRGVLGLELPVGEPGVAGFLLLQPGDEAVELDLARVELLFGACDEVPVNAVQLGHLKREAAAGLSQVQLIGGGQGLPSNSMLPLMASDMEVARVLMLA